MRRLAAWVLPLMSAAGCSLALDFDDECAVDDDCAPIGRGLRCDRGFCIEKDLVEISGPCNRIYGQDPRTAEPGTVVLLGSLLPRSGALGALGDGMDNGARLAIDEINQAGGLGGKKLGVLSCDDGTDPALAERAARHLVDVGKVDAIIGAGGSSVTIEVFNRVAKTARVLLMSPSSSSPAISTLADDGLLWRTVPSDAIQGRAIAEYIMHKGYKVVGVVNRNDAYGNGLAAAIESRLCTSGRFDCTTDSYLPDQYTVDEQSPLFQVDQERALATFAAKRPNVVVLIGYVSDGIAFLNRAQGSALSFILTDGMRAADLLGTNPAQVGVQDEAILCALVGTNPASPSGELFDQFALRYQRNYQTTPTTFAANAYDAAYLIVLAHAAALGAGVTDPDGRSLAEGLVRMSTKGATPVVLGAEGFGLGVSKLAESRSGAIDVQGISGPLDFDASLGEAPSGIEMWGLDLERHEISNLGVVYDGGDVYDFAGIVLHDPSDPICSPAR